MAETHHLHKHGQTQHFCRRVQIVLVPVVGKTFVKKSPETSDLEEAKILRNALNVQIDAEFAAAEAQGEGAASPLKRWSMAKGFVCPDGSRPTMLLASIASRVISDSCTC